MVEDEAPRGRTYGLLVVGDHVVGIDVKHLSEVAPITKLSSMMSESAAGLGLVALRGSLIPVCDPMVLCGGSPAITTPKIAAVVTDRRLVFALGIDGIAGLHRCTNDEIQMINGRATLPLEDRIVHVVDAEEMLARADIPHAEYHLRRHRGAKDAAGPPHLTFAAGGASFAVRATSIFGSVPKREIEDRALANGPFLGLINHFGRRIPVVDTCQVFGIGAPSHSAAREIVVLQLGEHRLLGLAVDKIRRIQHFSRSMLDPLDPRFRASLPLVEASARATEGQIFVVDDKALGDCQKISRLAEMSEHDGSSEAQGEPVPVQETLPKDVVRERVRHLLFTAGEPMASPMTDIVRILPPPEFVTPAPNGSMGMVGYFYSDGELTPLVSLPRVFGLESDDRSEMARVLLVGPSRGRVGFLVEHVDGIAVSNWRSCEANRMPKRLDMVELRYLGENRIVNRLPISELCNGIFDAA